MREPIDRLVAVQALIYRREWQRFLEILTPGEARRKFLAQYITLRHKLRGITNDEQLDILGKELSSGPQVYGSDQERSFKENLQIYRELIRQGDNLMNFLESAADILSRIEDIEKYRRGFDLTKIKATDLEIQQDNINIQGLSNKVLETLYNEAIISASELTGLSEKNIRKMCENKLITSEGKRSFIVPRSAGIDYKVLHILESKSLIRTEVRYGAKWLELSDERLVGAIKDSNKEFKMKKHH